MDPKIDGIVRYKVKLVIKVRLYIIWYKNLISDMTCPTFKDSYSKAVNLVYASGRLPGFFIKKLKFLLFFQQESNRMNKVLKAINN